MNKEKVLEVLQREIDKHQEYAKVQRETYAKHGWQMFVNGMVEAMDIIKELEDTSNE